MTLRVSFPKLLFETLRRHLAAVLITVLAFFIHIISFFMRIQNIVNLKIASDVMYSESSNTSLHYIMLELEELTLPNITNMLLAILLGVYLAFDFFRYMHSKKETDFYESMPIRRQKWFFTLVTASVGIFLLLAAMTIGIELAIIYAVGYGSKIMGQNMLWNLICMIGAFLTCWITTALAMVITGHSIIALLSLGVFASYVPLIIANLIPTYASVFLKTYVYQPISSVYYYFSPITLAYNASYNWDKWNLAEHWTYLLGCFIFTLAVGFITYLLFLRRPSESAGRAMAFERINSIIRFLLVVPSTLYVGLMLQQMSAFASVAWHIFGIVFGGFLIHGIIECIFQFDIRALLSKKRQLLFTILLCLGFAFVFWTDLFHYDEYIPNEQDIESIHFDSMILDNNTMKWSDLKDGFSGQYINEALEVVMDVQKSSTPLIVDYGYYDNITVTYQLKNGRKILRQYKYYGETHPESLDKLSVTEEFKDDFCILYHLDEINILNIAVSNGLEYFELDMTEKELHDFIKIYRNAYEQQSLSQADSDRALYELEITYSLKENERIVKDQYKIATYFTETIDFLKKFNVVSIEESSNIILEYLEIEDGPGGYFYVDNETQLKELRPYIIPHELMPRNQNGYFGCYLRYKKNGTTEEIIVNIKSEHLTKILEKK